MTSVIWDMGGTLVDTYPDVDRALAAAVHAEVDDNALMEVARLTRVSSSRAISTLAGRYDVPEETLRSAYNALKDRWERQAPPLMDGVLEVMDAVRAAGGVNLVATHRDRDSATVLVESLGLEIDDMVCAPDGFPRKPDPAMHQALLERNDLTAQDCLAVGDRPADVEAAEAAGIRAYLLTTPGIPLGAPGMRRIESLSELPV
ncbi:HAD-IA family hydrolase [Brachybacterium epidermidis]|uniref:HAD-IA family hydrolase n=1 Tax=Brachybacterium epidermidis TaxID=2781983 RepID=UPI00398EBC9E